VPKGAGVPPSPRGSKVQDTVPRPSLLGRGDVAIAPRTLGQDSGSAFMNCCGLIVSLQLCPFGFILSRSRIAERSQRWLY